MYSIRKRLTLVLAAGLLLLIGGAGMFATTMLGRRATDEFDAALLVQARALVALTEEEAGHIEFDYRADQWPQFERSEAPDYFQFWLEDGLVLLRSKRLTHDLPRAPNSPNAQILGDVRFQDGRAGRLVQVTWTPRSAAAAPDIGDTKDPAESAEPPPSATTPAVTLVVARERTALDQLIANVELVVFGALGVATLLALLLVWRALAAGFRPIASIAAQVRSVDADGLRASIALPYTPRELAPIVQQLNALLQRLATSFERERRFAGNLAHELRTPIAELRSLATVGLRWPDDTTSVARFFGDVKDIAGRMEGLMTDLLLLARCQAGVERVANTRVHVLGVVSAAWTKLTDDTRRRGLTLRCNAPDDPVVNSDASKLAIVVGNLLGNAVSHAHSDSVVACEVVATGSTVRIEITNAADPLSADEMARLTEPFWRKGDGSATDHVGLGLPLVVALAELLGLTVAFTQDADGTFRVRVDGLPRADAMPHLLRGAS